MTSAAQRGLTRDAIKYFAAFVMLLNHIANIFLTTGTFLCELFLNAGYFTAIAMCYFLVEGYAYTRSKRRYFCRLLLFAVLSELPYCLAFSEGEQLSFCGMNMLFTLCLCFILVAARRELHSAVLCGAVTAAVFALSLFCSWAVLAPLFTLLFLWANGDTRKTAIAFWISAAAFELLNFLGGLQNFSFSINVLYSLLSMLGILLAGLCITRFYNGRRMRRGRSFSKWFFYLFYPLHLLLLGAIRLALL